MSSDGDDDSVTTLWCDSIGVDCDVVLREGSGVDKSDGDMVGCEACYEFLSLLMHRCLCIVKMLNCCLATCM